MTAQDRLIVAIDEADPDKALKLIERLEGTVCWLKVGMTLYAGAGPDFVRKLVRAGWKVFVDLKFHDIPHQVAGAVAVLADCGVHLLTVHTSGGAEMLKAASQATKGTHTNVLGVTVLTSLDQEALLSVGYQGQLTSLVLKRAQLALEQGLSGVVASPLEAKELRACLPVTCEIVTPGIRPSDTHAGDQTRYTTPSQAISYGATRLVVGRPITQSDDVALAAQNVLREIESAS
jgi:orotidine-5'-phosphate decarboxylase